MSIAKAVLNRAVPVPKLEDFDRFLFLGPHPDDIEIGAGATAARLASMGKAVRFLICIDGRFGMENTPEGTTPDELICIRQEEAKRAAAKLGVNDVRFLGLCDGGFYSVGELEDGIRMHIAEFKPDIILAPDPCVSSECHTDHLNVGNAAKQIAFFAHHEAIMNKHGCKGSNVKAVAFYMTAKYNRFFRTSGFLKMQLDALGEFPSQLPEGSADKSSIFTYIKLRSKLNGARCLCSDAEGFRVLGLTHMHCLPEFGD